MVDADAIAVVRTCHLGVAYPDRRAPARDVTNVFASLTDDASHAGVPERLEQLAIEGHAAFERRHHEVEVVNAHRPRLAARRQRHEDARPPLVLGVIGA